jgi:hypothetical protein
VKEESVTNSPRGFINSPIKALLKKKQGSYIMAKEVQNKNKKAEKRRLSEQQKLQIPVRRVPRTATPSRKPSFNLKLQF